MKRRYTARWLMLWLLLGLVAGCGNQEEAQGGQQTPDSQQEEQTDPKDDGADQPEDSKEEPQTPAGQGSRLEPAEEAAAQATAQGITQQGIYWRQGEDGKRYVVFNGVDRAYSGMQGHLDEKTGTLTINVHSADGSSGISVYEVAGSGEVTSVVVLDNGQQVEVEGFPG